MRTFGHIVILATMLAFLLASSAMLVGTLVTGRVKIEPASQWIVFRERPVRFGFIVLCYLALVGIFAVAVFKVGLL